MKTSVRSGSKPKLPFDPKAFLSKVGKGRSLHHHRSGHGGFVWGYGSMYVGNTFAYRATDQGRLLQVNGIFGA